MPCSELTCRAPIIRSWRLCLVCSWVVTMLEYTFKQILAEMPDLEALDLQAAANPVIFAP